MRTISEVQSQFGTGGSFLWGVRREGVHAPHFLLRDLARLDNRLEAHIDGLRVAGEEGWQLARRELGWKEPGEVFAAAVLAFESNDRARIAEVMSIGAVTPELARGVISALGWMEYEQAEPHIQRLCTSKPRSHRRIGIAAAAIHRKDPGQPLRDALESGDPLLRARAARAAGELGRTDLVPRLEDNLGSDQPGCRFWSAWSMALLTGYSSAVRVVQSFAESPGPFRIRACQLAMRRMGPSDGILWNGELRSRPGGMRLSVMGAGILGFPSLVPQLIEQMSDPQLARVAGEAFTMITGVDLAYDDLDRKAPEGFEAGPTEDASDDNVEMDPDERLPWPDPALVLGWWNNNEHRFAADTAYFMGQPWTRQWAEQVLRTGRQRQRAAAALELALWNPGKPLFEVRAPGFRQQMLLKLESGD